MRPGRQVKRFAFIAMTVVIVLAMTAGTAFASACFASRCDRPMGCETGVVDGHAGMHRPMSDARVSCNMGDKHRTSDASVSQASLDRSASFAVIPAVTSLPAPADSVLPAPVSGRARGAPQLSAVLRL